MPEGDPLRYITQVAQNAPNSHRFTCSHSFFGRFPAAMCAKRGRRRETIEFLGFKHICGVDRSGKIAVVRILSVKVAGRYCIARGGGWVSTSIG